jgi:hypothetical protein
VTGIFPPPWGEENESTPVATHHETSLGVK